MLAILDHALTRMTYVNTRYQAIQWLYDSMVFVVVEQDPSSIPLGDPDLSLRPYTEKVVRYFPDSDRREELLAIPRPAESSEP